MWFIHSIVGLDPPRATYRSKRRLWDKWPQMTTLEDSPLDMLVHCSTCWWNPLHRGLACKELLPSYVHISAGACSVMHEYDKYLDGLQGIEILTGPLRYQNAACMLCFGISVGAHASLSCASASTRWVLHATHELFFPCPPNANEVSHPVRAWNIGKGRDFSAPRQAAILWATKYRKLFPVPNANQTATLAGIVYATVTANTTTSVSPVHIQFMAMLCSMCML